MMHMRPGSCEKKLGSGFLYYKFFFLARLLTITKIVRALTQMKITMTFKKRKVNFVIA